MQENEFQSKFNHWKEANYRITAAEELKVCKGKDFYFSAIEEHQLNHLYNVKHGFFQHKIPDLGMQNPFDSFSLVNVPANIVVLFYRPRQPKIFYMIDIDVVNDEISKGIKSISELRAKHLSFMEGIIK